MHIGWSKREFICVSLSVCIIITNGTLVMESLTSKLLMALYNEKLKTIVSIYGL